MEKSGKVFLIAAPSGAGKSSLIQEILVENEIELSISATTRRPRSNETNGKDYFFLSDAEFQEEINLNNFLEYAKVHNYLYGTLKDQVTNKINNGINVILDIDVQGFHQIKDTSLEFISIFIIPPSINELRNRLLKRNLDSTDSINTRIMNAKSEIKNYNFFDYLILNDDFERASKLLKNIINGLCIDTNEHNIKNILNELLS
jgi:guanylate kinase